MSLGLGGGYSQSKSKQKQQNFPNFARPLFEALAGYGTDTGKLYDPTGGALRQDANRLVSDTVGGKYLSPDSNPYLQQTADALARNSREQFAQNLARVNGAAAQGGSLLSTRAALAGGQVARAGAQDLNDSLTRLYAGNYGAERGLQTQASQQAVNNSLLPLNQLLAIMGMLKGSAGKSSGTQSGWSVSGNAGVGGS